MAGSLPLGREIRRLTCSLLPNTHRSGGSRFRGAGVNLPLFAPPALDLLQRVAGVDEAGRGPLAGPVAVAAVILDPLRPIDGLADSKALSATRREALAPLIRARAIAWHVEFVEVVGRFQAVVNGWKGARNAVS